MSFRKLSIHQILVGKRRAEPRKDTRTACRETSISRTCFRDRTRSCNRDIPPPLGRTVPGVKQLVGMLFPPLGPSKNIRRRDQNTLFAVEPPIQRKQATTTMTDMHACKKRCVSDETSKAKAMLEGPMPKRQLRVIRQGSFSIPRAKQPPRVGTRAHRAQAVNVFFFARDWPPCFRLAVWPVIKL